MQQPHILGQGLLFFLLPCLSGSEGKVLGLRELHLGSLPAPARNERSAQTLSTFSLRPDGGTGRKASTAVLTWPPCLSCEMLSWQRGPTVVLRIGRRVPQWVFWESRCEVLLSSLLSCAAHLPFQGLLAGTSCSHTWDQTFQRSKAESEPGLVLLGHASSCAPSN